RRFNRADTAIVGRVNVAHFKAGTFTGQTAWPKRRHTAFVGDFGKRVRLVHELGQLRATEKFANRCNSRFGVDQVVRHHGGYVNARHTFLDRTLHTKQADAILVFQQLAHRTHTTVAEVVDIVNFALAVLQIDEGFDHGQDVFLTQDGIIIRRIEIETHVEFHTANGAQVI